MKLKKGFLMLCSVLCILSLAGCGSDKRDSNKGVSDTKPTEIEEAAVAEEKEEAVKEDIEESKKDEEKVEFQLTEDGKEFLHSMCYYLPEFSGSNEINDEFWKNFIFYSYTSASADDHEIVEVYREDLEFNETEVKVSKEIVADYVKLALGIDLPAYEPAFEDMEEGQTACYFKDGYYYIGVSDFGDISYEYKACTTNEDDTASVEYTTFVGGEEEIGSIIFAISPAENKNGFVIDAKSIINQ